MLSRRAEWQSLRDRINLFLEARLDRALGPMGVRLYRLTRGGIARLVRVNVLVVTTRGRRSGRARAVLLAYFPQGGSFVVVAANAGQPITLPGTSTCGPRRLHAWKSGTAR